MQRPDTGADSKGDRARPGGAGGGRVVLVGGGVRSGKSRFALERARSLGRRRVFLATAEARDGEMTERIAAHARTRGDDFRTIEEPEDVPEALLAMRDVDVVVVDCLTIWISNLVCAPGATAAGVERRLGSLAAALGRRAFHAVVVTNEVGMGIVPETPLGRLFRDLAGAAHQALAAIADEVYLGAMGVMLRLHPAPVAVEPRPATNDEAQRRTTR